MGFFAFCCRESSPSASDTSSELHPYFWSASDNISAFSVGNRAPLHFLKQPCRRLSFSCFLGCPIFRSGLTIFSLPPFDTITENLGATAEGRAMALRCKHVLMGSVSDFKSGVKHGLGCYHFRESRHTHGIGNTYGIDGKFVVVDRPEKVGLNLMISLRKILNCTPCGMIAALGKDGLAHIAAPNPKFPCDLLM
ncbi:histone H3 K4-specific methyltransferase SET7/9family protein, partial [Striga asiatica]